MIRQRSILLCVLVALACCTRSVQASALHAVGRVESVDAISGLHWRMVGDPAHPEAPPRLVLTSDTSGMLPAKEPPLHSKACIRAGSHIRLRAANANVSATSLDAIALESGACGARIRARVSATGGLVEATVLDAQAGVLAAKAAVWR